MKNVEIKQIITKRVDFKNILEPNVKIGVKNTYSYNVRYSKNDEIGKGEFSAEISSPENDSFYIKVEIVGIFTFNKEVDKASIHKASYDAIFPYVRSFVTNLTASSGIPPIYIPYIDISSSDVYRIEIPGKE